MHSSEKYENPETFTTKVNEICEAYTHAMEYQEEGIHVVSTDEMTGIQALERKYTNKLALPGKNATMEFEYIRHGTTSLIGCFEVATGRLYEPYLNGTRTEIDFCNAISKTVETDPNGTWIFVCDGLNTHMSATLVEYVAKTCNLDVELGVKGKYGILKNKESRQKFLHDTNHGVRFLYTPKHSSWMNQIEIWFGIICRKLLKRKSYISVVELEASIRRFIEQYNLLAHPFKWTYTGVPLTL